MDEIWNEALQDKIRTLEEGRAWLQTTSAVSFRPVGALVMGSIHPWFDTRGPLGQPPRGVCDDFSIFDLCSSGEEGDVVRGRCRRTSGRRHPHPAKNYSLGQARSGAMVAVGLVRAKYFMRGTVER